LILLTCLAAAQRPIPPGIIEGNRQAEELNRALRPQSPQVREPEFLEMQRNAKELSELARSVPSDIDQTMKGMLPKDLVNRLKRIEKLAKQLRNQVSR
jgi:hypothetical protein